METKKNLKSSTAYLFNCYIWLLNTIARGPISRATIDEKWAHANANEGWNKTSVLPWLNAGFLKFTNEIDHAVLILHGEKAHSRYFGITAYENMTGSKVDLQGQDANLQPLNAPLAEPLIITRGNKQLYIVPNATHCDLYDGGEDNYIPFDYIENFYKENLQ